MCATSAACTRSRTSRVVDSLMQMAKDSRQQGWWHAFGDIPYSVYIGLETDAASLRVYEPQVVPGLLQTRGVRGGPHHRRAAGDARPAMWRSASRYGCAGRSGSPSADGPLRLWAVVDEAALRRVVGNKRDDARAAGVPRRAVPAAACHGPGAAVRAWARIPASPGSTPSWSSPTRRIRASSTSRASPATCIWRRPNDVQKYSVMYEHLRAQALNVDQTREFIADIAKDTYATRERNATRRRREGGTVHLATACPEEPQWNMPPGRVNGRFSAVECCRVAS